MLTGAEPETLGDATLTAVTVTVLLVGIDCGRRVNAGARILPTVLLPPATPFTCHVTGGVRQIADAGRKGDSASQPHLAGAADGD